MTGLYNNISNISFKQTNSAQKRSLKIYSADKFVYESKRNEEKRVKGDFLARNFGSPTAYRCGLGVALLGELICLFKVISKKNQVLPIIHSKQPLIKK